MRNRSCTDLPSYYAPSPGAWLKNDRPYPLEVYDITSLHFHDTLELGVCSECQGVCRVEDREYPFCEGDVQVIFPFQNHLSRSEGGRQSKWYWVNLDPLDVLGTWGAPELGRLEQMLREKMGLCGILDRKKYPFLCELVRHVVLPGEETRRLVSLYALIVELAKVSSDLPKLSLSPARHFSRLLPAIEQMQSRLEEDLSTGVPADGRSLRAELCAIPKRFSCSNGLFSAAIHTELQDAEGAAAFTADRPQNNGYRAGRRISGCFRVQSMLSRAFRCIAAAAQAEGKRMKIVYNLFRIYRKLIDSGIAEKYTYAQDYSSPLYSTKS